ncbi:MAG: NUDIX domain-containing protein [Candidatus Kaiserbacteria bacterium]|nr:MAG: NUDIX domain-containing protein [Candidatus Kaiserbacteria bacterium]
MRIIRHAGTLLSLFLIECLHVVRYFLARVGGGGEIQGVRLILVQERRVVLVSHWYAPWAWTLPGGGVSKKEAPEDAAMREAKEETGFEVKTIAGEIGTYTGSMGKKDKVRVYYTGDFEGSLAMRPNLEIMARSWFDLDNLPEELSPANKRRIEAYKAGVREEKGR